MLDKPVEEMTYRELFIASWQAAEYAALSLDAALVALQIASLLFKRGKPLPQHLAAFFADAFDSVTKETDHKKQERALLSGLCISPGHKRPSIELHKEALGFDVAWQIGDGHNETDAIYLVAQETDCSLTTVRKHYRKFMKNWNKMPTYDQREWNLWLSWDKKNEQDK